MLCGQRQLAKFRQWDAHTGSLFFHKRTGTGSADLVHLKIHNFTVLDADVFAILSADLKHGIDFRHPMSSSLGLRSDLIPDSICSDTFADALSS